MDTKACFSWSRGDIDYCITELNRYQIKKSSN
uniref:Uncharacterized protein n=1 Tax=Arundo donax TaxID=35708 RepID=A0A0A9CG05_ARUDO